MTEPLFFDTDCISAFLWVDNESILSKLFPGRIIIPKEVYDELSHPSVNRLKALKQQVDLMFQKGEAVIETITVGTPTYKLYRQLTNKPEPGHKIIGRGEAASISLAKEKQGILASNNLKDITIYVEKYKLTHYTTGDIMKMALDAGFITEAQGNAIWANMIAHRRKHGVENWNAVTNVADMLQDKSFSNINIDYYLIDELHPAEGQKDAVTEGILNCVTALIEVERSKNQKNLEEILHQLSMKLNTKEKLSRFRTFLRFLRRYVSAKFKKEIPNDFRNMEEAINMTRDFAAMERAEGIIEGANAREIAIVNRMLEKGKNIDEIADLCGIDLDTVLKYKADREKAVTN